MEIFEQLYKGYNQHLEITEVLFEQRTEHQHLIIFQNPCFGRVLALDDWSRQPRLTSSSITMMAHYHCWPMVKPPEC